MNEHHMTLNAAMPSVVQTLLQVGELVFETDVNGFIISVWARDTVRQSEYVQMYEGKTIRQLFGHEAADNIKHTLRQKKTQYFEHVSPLNKSVVTILRFIPIHRREERVFVMLEYQRAKDPDKFLEQRLKQAGPQA